MPRKKQVNARVSEDLYKCVVARSRLLEESIGHYLGLIAQHWFAQGQPPVNEQEARVCKRLRSAEARDKSPLGSATGRLLR